MLPIPKQKQKLDPVSPQEAQDIREIIDKYPQFAAAKKIREEKETHFRRLCERADSEMDVCDPWLILDRGGVYGAVEKYVDLCIEERIRGLELGLRLSGGRETTGIMRSIGRTRMAAPAGKDLGTKTVTTDNAATLATKTTTPLNMNTASAMQTPNSVVETLPLLRDIHNNFVRSATSASAMAKVASPVTKTTTPVNKNLAPAMQTPSSLRPTSRLNITTSAASAKETLVKIEPQFSRHKRPKTHLGFIFLHERNFNLARLNDPQSHVAVMDLTDPSDDEDFRLDTPTQHSNRTTSGPCYVDRFRAHDPPDTMFVYDSHSDRVFDTRSGSYVDEALPSPKRQRRC